MRHSSQISTRCQNNLDYMDDNAERLGRQKMRTDAMKRQFAIQGARHVLHHLEGCQFELQTTSALRRHWRHVLIVMAKTIPFQKLLWLPWAQGCIFLARFMKSWCQGTA